MMMAAVAGCVHVAPGASLIQVGPREWPSMGSKPSAQDDTQTPEEIIHELYSKMAGPASQP